MMEGGGDMLILLTGVGGALSARGRDIPAKWGGDVGQRVQGSLAAVYSRSVAPPAVNVSDSTMVRRQMSVR